MSFGVGNTANLSSVGNQPQTAPRAPAPVQTQNWLRRRMQDAVEDVFQLALQRGDLASAADLLGVLENMHARARVRFQGDRRGTAQMIERCRKALEERKPLRRPVGG